jgi:hypothetical protein
VIHALRTRSWSKDGDFAPYLFLLHVSHQLQSLRVHGQTFLQPDPCSLLHESFAPAKVRVCLGLRSIQLALFLSTPEKLLKIANDLSGG